MTRDNDLKTPWRYSWVVQWPIFWLQKPFKGVEWTENPLSFPHCNGQARCWMHVRAQWCDCVCRWCRVARFLRRDGKMEVTDANDRAA